MNHKFIVVIIIAIVIAIITIALLIFGISTHEEPGFDDTFPPWNREDLPLKVSCVGYTHDRSPDCFVALDVMETINARLGFHALHHVTMPDEIPVNTKIIIGVPQNTGPGKGQDDEGNLFHAGENTALYSSGGKATRCEIRASNTGFDPMLWLVIYHGFGHCFGLAHDDFERSIMRPLQREFEAAKFPPWFTDYDRSLIRDRYMKR